MRTTTTLLFVCLLAGVAGASSATAGQSDIAAKASTAFTGNLCGLLKPAQIAALDMKGCVARPPIHAAFTIYSATWGTPQLLGTHRRAMTVQVYQGSAFVSRFKRGLPGSSIKIGNLTVGEAWTSNGGALAFVVGPYACAITIVHDAPSRAENIGEIGAASASIVKTLAKAL